MERRLLLAIVLTFVVLTAYQWLVPMSQPAPASQTKAAPVTTTPAAQSPAGSGVTTTPAMTTPEPPAAVEAVKADTAEIAKVESDARFEGRQIVMIISPK